MTAKSVTVYSTPTCPYCVRAKEYLTRKGVVYKDLNVAVDRTAAHEMVQKSDRWEFLSSLSMTKWLSASTRGSWKSCWRK